MIMWWVILDCSLGTPFTHFVSINVLSGLIFEVKLASGLSLRTSTSNLLHLLDWLVVVLLRWSGASYLIVQESAILVFYDTSSLSNWATWSSWLQSLHWISIGKEWTWRQRLWAIQMSLLLVRSWRLSNLLTGVLNYASEKSLRHLVLRD